MTHLKISPLRMNFRANSKKWTRTESVAPRQPHRWRIAQSFHFPGNPRHLRKVRFPALRHGNLYRMHKVIDRPVFPHLRQPTGGGNTGIFPPHPFPSLREILIRGLASHPKRSISRVLAAPRPIRMPPLVLRWPNGDGCQQDRPIQGAHFPNGSPAGNLLLLAVVTPPIHQSQPAYLSVSRPVRRAVPFDSTGKAYRLNWRPRITPCASQGRREDACELRVVHRDRVHVMTHNIESGRRGKGQKLVLRRLLRIAFSPQAHIQGQIECPNQGNARMIGFCPKVTTWT